MARTPQATASDVREAIRQTGQHLATYAAAWYIAKRLTPSFLAEELDAAIEQATEADEIYRVGETDPPELHAWRHPEDLDAQAETPPFEGTDYRTRCPRCDATGPQRIAAKCTFQCHRCEAIYHACDCCGSRDLRRDNENRPLQCNACKMWHRGPMIV